MKNAGRTFIIVILALLVLSPIDILPDVIPAAGQLDDILYILGIVMTVLKMIQGRKEQEVIVDSER